MKQKTYNIKPLVTCVLLSSAVTAEAGIISNRTELNDLLGANQTLENFEGFSISAQTRYSGGPLSYDTTVGALGNHLVKPGVTYQRNPDYGTELSGYRGIDLNPSGYFGATSQRLAGAGGCCSASIRDDFQFIFTAPITAFGLDLNAYNGFASTGKVSVYDTQNNLLTSQTVTGTVEGSFFGWENDAGIGKVFFHDVPTRNYIQFDNLGYGVAAVPLPGAFYLFGSALAGLSLSKRRKA
jgi:hypothetical protein